MWASLRNIMVKSWVQNRIQEVGKRNYMVWLLFVEVKENCYIPCRENSWKRPCNSVSFSHLGRQKKRPWILTYQRSKNIFENQVAVDRGRD